MRVAVRSMRGPRAAYVAHLGRYVAGLACGAGLLALAVPSVSGLAWSGVVAALGAVPLTALALLIGLWLLGLLAHTITLTAALPTLTHRRALTLSLTGSAVANVLPMGGAAGMALNYRMLRSWGYDSPQYGTYTVVTNLWDVVAKLTLPVLVLPVVVLTSSVALPHVAVVAGLLALILVVVAAAAAAAAALTSARAAVRVGTALDRMVRALPRRRGSPRTTDLTGWLVRTQMSCCDVVARGWARLTLGMLLYTALLLALLVACLSVTGAGLALPVVLVGFMVERLLTLAGLTPGGAGVVELGLTGVLLLLGGSPASVVPGVLLYRALTFALEIPVGGSALLGWLVLRHRALRRDASASAFAGVGT